MEKRVILAKFENFKVALKEMIDFDFLDKDSKKALKDIRTSFNEVKKDMKKLRKEVHGNK